MVFDVPELESLDFTPGQFVSLTRSLNGKPITRAYSTVAPAAANRFEVCLNRVQDGVFSPFLFDLAPGDEVDMKGVFGTFVWRRPMSDSVLVATGTGVAPFRSMLASFLGKGGGRDVTLLFGARYEHGLLYRGEFASWAASHPGFRFWPTLTRPEPGWSGRTGRVQEYLFEATGLRRDVDVYICGLKAMVDDVRAKLTEAGFERKRIVYEKYD